MTLFSIKTILKTILFIINYSILLSMMVIFIFLSQELDDLLFILFIIY
jgi:hypothetical protein